MILTQQLTTNASKNLTKPGVHYLGKDVNYKTLLAAIARLSYLYQNELGFQVRMAFLCRNSTAFITTFFAMTNIRAVSIPIDPDAPPEEVEKWLRESKATHVAATNDLVGRAREILQAARLSLPIIEIEKKNGGEYDTTFSPVPEQSPKENDPILLLRSGGNTDKPKFAIFTHKQLIHATSSLKGLYHLTGTDRFHTTLSWHHPFPFIHGMLFPIMASAVCVIDHGLQALEFLEFLSSAKVTRMIGTPPYFLKLLLVCKNEKRVLPGIKSITVGLGPLSAELKKAFDLLKISVSQCYGQIENFWTIAMQDTQTPGELAEGYVRGFVGKGLPGLKYKVMDANGDQVEGKERRMGQLAISGPSIMHSYLDREKANKMALRGSWLYTGDIFQLEGEAESLTLAFICRKDDLFMIDGQPIFFNQVDAAIRSNSAVQDAATFTIKNGRNDSVIVCAVVRRPGAILNETQLLDFCKTHLPSHLVPKAAAFTDVIARDAGNNINYFKLRGQYAGLVG